MIDKIRSGHPVFGLGESWSRENPNGKPRGGPEGLMHCRQEKRAGSRQRRGGSGSLGTAGHPAGLGSGDADGAQALNNSDHKDVGHDVEDHELSHGELPPAGFSHRHHHR